MLRGLSMFVMIFLHTSAYFLSVPLVFLLWNYSEFAVPIFIFCSSYVFFMKKYPIHTWQDIFAHIKKRLLRLLIPYYVFAVVFILIERIKEPSKLTYQYVFKNLFVVGGISINWLVLLFICFTFLMPFILYLHTKRGVLFYLFMLISGISAFLLMLYRFPLDYRFIFWLPWSLLVIFSLFVVENEHKKWFFPAMFFFWMIVFFTLQNLQVSLHHSITMYDNKYPPNLYHLAFGIFSTIGLYVIAKKGIFSLPLIKSLLLFLSKNSYSLFFIHWLVIYVMTVFFHFTFTWVSFFTTVFLFSIVMQIVLNRLSLLTRGIIASQHYTWGQRSEYSQEHED